MSTAIVAIIPYGVASLTNEMIALICNVTVAAATLSTIVSLVSMCCTGPIAVTITEIIKLVISYALPSLVMAIQMIYYGVKKKKGCIYKFKWFGGASVSF